jgi:hypothetical protein
MRRYLLLCSLVILTICSCRSDFDFEPSTGNLRFSKDTVYLDTVFTNIGSSTYTLKVYNKSNKNISIPNIQLGEGNNSKYRLMVDGMPGRVFNNVELLARDSMFIFIETTIDYNEYANSETTFLYTDHIEFGTNSDFQKVELVTLVQDAVFLYPKKFSDGTTETLPIGSDEIYGFYLDPSDPMNGDELHWTNTKPYVIYGYAAVPPASTLTIDAGVRAHFHAESGLIVANTASLQVNGTTSLTEDLENEVIFESDRLEPSYSDVPGQWGTVWFTQGSTNNSITNLTLKNATVGMLVSGNDGTPTPTLDLTNVQIYNCSNVGILARTGNITGKNIAINNCGETSLACSFGGSYEFTHCTFANYWPKPNQTSVLIDDYDGSATYALTKADFRNCIIFGSPNFAINLKKEGTTFNYQFENCLIKFADFSNQFTTHPEYQFTGSNYTNCIIATNSTVNKPDFLNTDQNKLIIGEDSAAKGMANSTYSTFNDILDKPRNSTSGYDIGAYNFIVFPN